MKKVCLLILAVMVVSVSFAGVSFTWSTSASFFKSDTTLDLDSYFGDVGIGNSVFWGLIWSDSAVAPTITSSGQVGSAVVNGLENILDVRYFATGWSDPDVNDYETQTVDGVGYLAGLMDFEGVVPLYESGTLSGGYIYQVVFTDVVWDGTTLGFTSESINYWVSDAFALTNQGVPMTPQNFDVSEQADYLGIRVDGVLNADQIPEPTTMALLGLGGLVMAIRRRRA